MNPLHATRCEFRIRTRVSSSICSRSVRKASAEAHFRFKYTFNQKISHPEIFDTFCVFRCVACNRIYLKKERFDPVNHPEFAVFGVFRQILPKKGVKTYFLSKNHTPSKAERGFRKVRQVEPSSKATEAVFRIFDTFNQKSLNPVFFDTLASFEGAVFKTNFSDFPAQPLRTLAKHPFWPLFCSKN
jgi:hypothetical protein